MRASDALAAHPTLERRRQVGARALVATLLAAALTVTASAYPATAADGLPQWPANPDWQSLVPGPASDDVRPVGVVRTHGSVTNPAALTAGSGQAVMTMEPGGPPAIVVLDYGREVGGTPYVTVGSSTPTAPATSNTLRLSTSEALPFLNANTTTTLSRDVNAGDSNVKVASIVPFYVGSPITIGTGTGSQTRDVTAIGTAAAPDTSLVLPAVSGDTNASVASVNGYTVGSPLTIGAETATITAVGTAAGAPTTVVYPASAGTTNVKVASIAGFATGQRLLLDTGASFEIRTVGAVGTAATTARLFSAASAGDTNVTITSTSGLTVGGEIDIEPGPSGDHVTITSVGTAGTNSTVAAPNVTSGMPVPSLTGANWIWNIAGASGSTPPGTMRG